MTLSGSQYLLSVGHGASTVSTYRTYGTYGTAVITAVLVELVPWYRGTGTSLYQLVPVPQYIQHTTSLYGTRPSSPSVWGECRGSEDLKVLGTSA